MNILVTGGAGFVGTNLIKKLLSRGNNVLSVDNYSTGTKENHIEGCRYIEDDLLDNAVFDWLPKIDCIYHLAAVARIQPSLITPKNSLVNNFNGTLNVLETARMEGVQVIYAGSSSKHHGLYDSPYAWSKYGGEELCKLYNKVYGLNTTICRFYNVYGEHMIKNGAYATVLGIFQDQYEQQQPLTITGDGEQRRDFTHVEDVVEALYSLLGRDFGECREFELGRGSNVSINELANMFGEDYPKQYIPARKGEYPITLCDYTEAKKALCWTPTKNVEDYIKSKL